MFIYVSMGEIECLSIIIYMSTNHATTPLNTLLFSPTILSKKGTRYRHICLSIQLFQNQNKIYYVLFYKIVINKWYEKDKLKN